MKKTFKLFWIIAMLTAIGFSFAACDMDGGSDDEWSNNIPLTLVGSWYYETQELFSIEAGGSGSIEGQDDYSVQVRYNPHEVRFMKESGETGQFSFSFNGDGDMDITAGTGPYATWANLMSVPNEPEKRIYVKIVSDKIITTTILGLEDYSGGDVYLSKVTFSLGRATKSYNNRMQ
jgi:hypothetical protein